MSLVLPWEIIERVIDHAWKDLDVLYTFSLTCRQLRPRSVWLMIIDVYLGSRDKAFAFSNFLCTNTGLPLQEHIKSLNVSPANFPPFPLVQLLPNLSILRFVSPENGKHQVREDRLTVRIHPTTLSYYPLCGKRIRALSLCGLSFVTSSDLFRLVLAFPNITEIVCEDILITTPINNPAALNVTREKLFKHLRLETVDVSESQSIIPISSSHRLSDP